MHEQLLPDKYAHEFSRMDMFERADKLKELKEIIEVMSPAELASATIDFIGMSNILMQRIPQNRKGWQIIALALSTCKDMAIEQYTAARKIGDDAAAEGYAIIFEAARFEYELLTNPDFHPVTIPISCDKIYSLASK